MKKLISIVSSCYNEEQNVAELYERVKVQMEKFSDKYDYEQILVDNCSTDNTVNILKNIAKNDNRLKIIVNSRNFGHIRSPFWAIINGNGDAVIYMASDLQDPPELIPQFIEKWEQGYKYAFGQKTKTEESFFVKILRKSFYILINKLADDNTEMLNNCTGFGLYDKSIIDILKKTDDTYPYTRGLIRDIGFEVALIPFTQPKRKYGKTKNNFYTLYDNAMIGIVKHSKVPLRIMTFSGFILAFISMLTAFVYFIYKLLHWNTFNAGMAPVVTGLFFFSSIQLFFLGILVEYIGAIYTRIDKKPIVVEKERINF